MGPLTILLSYYFLAVMGASPAIEDPVFTTRQQADLEQARSAVPTRTSSTGTATTTTTNNDDDDATATGGHVTFPGWCPETCPPPGAAVGYGKCHDECGKNRWVRKACRQKCKEVCDMCRRHDGLLEEEELDEVVVAMFPKCPTYHGAPPQPTWTGCLD